MSFLSQASENLHGGGDKPDPQKQVANVGADEVATNANEPYPLIFGTRPVAAQWQGRIYNQRTVAVYRKSGGKKGNK